MPKACFVQQSNTFLIGYLHSSFSGRQLLFSCFKGSFELELPIDRPELSGREPENIVRPDNNVCHYRWPGFGLALDHAVPPIFVGCAEIASDCLQATLQLKLANLLRCSFVV